MVRITTRTSTLELGRRREEEKKEAIWRARRRRGDEVCTITTEQRRGIKNVLRVGFEFFRLRRALQKLSRAP